MTKGRAHAGGWKKAHVIYSISRLSRFGKKRLFLFFYMISLPRVPSPRGRIFSCLDSPRRAAVDLIIFLIRPGRYYGNFLGTELQFNFAVWHMNCNGHRETRFIPCTVQPSTAQQSRFLMKMILKRRSAAHKNPISNVVVECTRVCAGFYFKQTRHNVVYICNVCIIHLYLHYNIVVACIVCCVVRRNKTIRSV